MNGVDRFFDKTVHVLASQHASVADQRDVDAPRPACGNHVEEARMHQGLPFTLQFDARQIGVDGEKALEDFPFEVALSHASTGAESTCEVAARRRFDLSE